MKIDADRLYEQSNYIIDMESAKRVLTGLMRAYVDLKQFDYEHFLRVIDMNDCEEARYLWRSFFVLGEILKACDIDMLAIIFAKFEKARGVNVVDPYTIHVDEDIEP